mmetsp:Transcript_72750/g.190728  ORF Transcript_72750/g.190728 Transcript_72750/m.190728 type:complete len:278 (-) Transcript_72750:267-1100(-)
MPDEGGRGGLEELVRLQPGHVLARAELRAGRDGSALRAQGPADHLGLEEGLQGVGRQLPARPHAPDARAHARGGRLAPEGHQLESAVGRAGEERDRRLPGPGAGLPRLPVPERRVLRLHHDNGPHAGGAGARQEQGHHHHPAPSAGRGRRAAESHPAPQSREGAAGQAGQHTRLGTCQPGLLRSERRHRPQRQRESRRGAPLHLRPVRDFVFGVDLYAGDIWAWHLPISIHGRFSPCLCPPARNFRNQWNHSKAHVSDPNAARVRKTFRTSERSERC